MRELMKDFKRFDLFTMYNERANPFSFVTTKLDITNLYKLGKRNKNQYATIGYYISKVANRIDAFKYRFEDGHIYKYDVIRPSYTNMFEDGNIGFYSCHMMNTYEENLEDYNAIYSAFKERGESIPGGDQGEFWLSCQPWFSFTGLVTPFDKSITIPQFIWDKFEFVEDRVYMHLMIMIHHGFADGSHIGKFINDLQKEIEEIKLP